MHTRDLLAALREMLDDETKPYLWPDASLVRKLDNAVREACLRARLLKDDEDSCPELCRLPVTAGQPLVRYANEILVVRNGRLASCNHKLWGLSAESMDRFDPRWQDAARTAGTPRFMVMDLAQHTLRLNRVPDTDDVLYLRAWRVPRACERLSVKDMDKEPAVVLPDPEELCHWAAHEAYMNQDADTQDKQAASDHLALFTQRFGSRPSLHDMARWADSPPRLRLAVMY